MRGTRRSSRRVPLVGLSLASLAVLPACSVSGLAFVQDDRVEVVEPSEGATVRLPFEVRWSVRGFSGSFLVLFDRPPMRPNQPLLSLVPSDDPCRREPSCPDRDWLADRDMYHTEETVVTVENLADRRPEGRGTDRHEVSIVLLDERGRRVGESVFISEFSVERED
jgi:hypothetical protein